MAVSMMSWVVAPQWVRSPASPAAPRQAAHQPDHRIADVAGAGGEFRGDRGSPTWRRRRSPRAASAGMMPSFAWARASAASTSSMRWK